MIEFSVGHLLHTNHRWHQLLFVLGLLYDKTDLINAYDDDKAMIADELRRLERQQAILALEIMRDVDRQWILASPGARARSQSILFPTGVDI